MANRKVLLVEGTDDLHVLRHICQNRNIPAPDSVEPLGGIPGLLEEPLINSGSRRLSPEKARPSTSLRYAQDERNNCSGFPQGGTRL